MSLEKWERDLRKQLIGVKSIKEPWEEALIEEIKYVPQQKPKNNLFLIGCVIFLTALMISFFLYKKGLLVHLDSLGWPGRGPISKQEFKTKIEDPVDFHDTIAKNQEDIAELYKIIEEIQNKLILNTDKINSNSEKITLTGIILNENFTIIRNGHDKSHLIYFNRDWSLEKGPRYLDLTENDREYLKKYINSKD